MYDAVIIGGGPAGMGAAASAYQNGIESVLILERADSLGGILQQCIHSGFGLHKFSEELTGPEYSLQYEQIIHDLGIEYLLNTMVLKISPQRVVTAMNESDGIFEIKAKAVILATGCRERPRGALAISGSRPAGIYTAGTAQKLVNINGYMPGKDIVVLGSGDIGLIMARRLTLEGAQVKAVCEVLPYPGGLARNVQQCLNDFDIPLKLSCTVTQIHGSKRIEGVTISKVDSDKKPVLGTKQFIPCDTLLLSVGLIPENELAKDAGIKIDDSTGGAAVNRDYQTSISGIFACGNALHVHDLVDHVSDEAELTGKAAADLVKRGLGNG